MNVETYGNILNRMKNHMIAGQNKITDFNKGSIIMTIFESVARPMEQAYIDTRNGYMNNLRAIAYSVFDFEKKSRCKRNCKCCFFKSKRNRKQRNSFIRNKSFRRYIYIYNYFKRCNTG